MDNYTLHNKIGGLSAAELAIKAAQPPTVKEDWTKKDYYYNPIKQRVKAELYVGQFDKCAFCRKVLEADGKYEPLEHIVAKSAKPKWMLEPKNLLLLCDSCNNLKGTANTLHDDYEGVQDLPELSEAYIVYNPHYDTWNEHLSIEDELFIVAVPDSKGAETIRAYELYRYNVIVNKAKEKKLGQKNPAQKVLHKFANMDKNNPLAQQLSEGYIRAITHFVERMNDIEGYN